MNLHHAAAVPDWESVRPAQRNRWQRLAARTNGVITPGNGASVVGVGLVGIGLGYVHAGLLWKGLLVVGAGRLCDIADGTLADRTHTKSPLGEVVDASLDKIVAFATLLIFAIDGIVPWPLAIIIGLQNSLAGILGLVAKSLKRAAHPVAAGKIGGAMQWAALLAFGLGHAAQQDSFGRPVIAAAYVLLAGAILLNFIAMIRYISMVRRS